MEKVDEIKFQGVNLDQKLRWKSHISHIHSKFAKCTAILGTNKTLFGSQILYTPYYSLFLPYVSCCGEVCGNKYKKNPSTANVHDAENSNKND